jgi:hypothetical protein
MTIAVYIGGLNRKTFRDRTKEGLKRQIEEAAPAWIPDGPMTEGVEGGATMYFQIMLMPNAKPIEKD